MSELYHPARWRVNGHGVHDPSVQAPSYEQLPSVQVLELQNDHRPDKILRYSV